VLFCSRKPI